MEWIYLAWAWVWVQWQTREHGNEHSGSVEGSEFIDQLNYC